MKNMKLALLCLLLSNIIFIKSMEHEEEEEEYPQNYRVSMTDEEQEETEEQDQRIPDSNTSSFQVFTAHTGFNGHTNLDNKMSDDNPGFKFQPIPNLQFYVTEKELAPLTFSNNTPILPTTIIEDYFKSFDIYTALAKCFEYIEAIDENWDRYAKEDIDSANQELIYHIVKKINFTEDAKPIFQRAVTENNSEIKAAVICSGINLDEISVADFYQRFSKLNKYGFRNIDEHYTVMIPYLTNVHSSLIIPILKLQIETGYPLLDVTGLLLNVFLLRIDTHMA